MRKLILLFSALVLCIGVVFGQGKTVSGRVIDENNEPAIGASIQVKGAETVGTISDFDGNFTITLPSGTTHLIISYVGYTTVEQKAEDGMVVRLTTDAEVLDEVMVVAYGTSTKKAFGGSATAVKAETLEKKNPTDVSKALAGEVAGVQVVSTSGQPGTSATIRIRGIGSINASTAPLYVVDGIPFDGDISSLDPNDIATMTVLKDATATALYGSRGANGVILYTTKKGTSGSSGRIEVDVKYGANMRLLPMYDFINDPQQYVELCWESMRNQLILEDTNLGSRTPEDVASANLFNSNAKGLPAAYNWWNENPADLIDPTTGKFYTGVNAPTLKQGYIDNPDPGWRKSIFRTGQSLDAKITISGGSDKTTYFTSFGYLNEGGYYIGSDFSRFNARVNVEHQAKKWLKGNLNMNYSYSIFDAPGQEGGGAMNNGFMYVNQCPVIYPVLLRDPNTGYVVEDENIPGEQPAYDYGTNTYKDKNGKQQVYGRLYGSGINPAGALQYDRYNVLQHQLVSTAMLEATLYKGLKLTANFGLTYAGSISSDLTNPYYGDAADVGRISKSSSHGFQFTSNQLLSYSNQFDVHNFEAFVGHESLYLQSSGQAGAKDVVARPDGLELSNAVVMSGVSSSTSYMARDSYFAQAKYNYKERYFIHANVRGDASSLFAPGRRWGAFGGVSLAWLISNEEFMSGVNLLRDLKLKASWGVLGNDGIGSYMYTNQYGIGNVNNQIAIIQSYQGNESLTWESSSMFNVGTEFSLGKYLTAELEYWYKHTSDMLMARYVAPSLGYGSYWINDAAMMNHGFEVMFNVHAVNTNAVKLDIRLNGSFYDSKMTKMPVDELGRTMDMNGAMALGHSQYDLYGGHYEGVTADGKAAYTSYYDKGKAGKELQPNDPELAQYFVSSVHQYILDQYRGKVSDKDLQKYLDNPDLILGKTYTTDPTYMSSFYLGKSAIPDWYGGFGFDLNVYGVELNATFQYQIGGWNSDAVYASLMHTGRAGETNWHQDMYTQARWTPEIGEQMVADGVELRTDINPALANGSSLWSYYGNGDRFLVSSSYLSLSNLSLGYNFPKKLMEKAKINSLRLFVHADNLFVLSARRGYNPMANFFGGSDASQYTPGSAIKGGFKISF